MIQVYQGNTLRINLTFSGDDGQPFDLTSYGLYYIAKQDYTQSTGDAPINIYTTGHDLPASGMTHIDLSADNTSVCPGILLAGITLVSIGSTQNVTTYETDGLEILPSTYFSPQ